MGRSSGLGVAGHDSDEDDKVGEDVIVASRRTHRLWTYPSFGPLDDRYLRFLSCSSTTKKTFLEAVILDFWRWKFPPHLT